MRLARQIAAALSGVIALPAGEPPAGNLGSRPALLQRFQGSGMAIREKWESIGEAAIVVLGHMDDTAWSGKGLKDRLWLDFSHARPGSSTASFRYEARVQAAPTRRFRQQAAG